MAGAMLMPMVMLAQKRAAKMLVNVVTVSVILNSFAYEVVVVSIKAWSVPVLISAYKTNT